MTKLWMLLKTFFSSGSTVSYIAMGVTSFCAIGAVSIGTVFVISAVTSPVESTTACEVAIVDASESETTTLIQQSTTTETSTAAETPTTMEAPTTTEVTTTPPMPTMAVEKLDIEDDKKSDETEPVRIEVDIEPETTEPATEATTKVTTEVTTKAHTEVTTESHTEVTTESHTEVTTEAHTEPPTEATIKEYTCIAKGIDISKWNTLNKTPIDWKKVKESGVEFVIIRAGYRSLSKTTMYKDPCFDEHIKGALAEGLQVGVYFYSQATTEQEALEEVSFLLDIIKDYTITYPVCFDWEPVANSRVRKANLTKTQATNIAKKFLATVESYGYEAMLYSYHSAIKEFFYTDQLTDYKTWMAYYFSKYKGTGVQYQVGDSLPQTSYPFQMWQYTSTATVPGIQGVVDMNVSFFSYNESGESNSAIILNLPAISYTTNVGTAIDYQAGIKAYNTAGMDVSADVTATITDTDGNLIAADVLFDTPGSHTITYTIKDFTGAKKTATANLTIRNKPFIALNQCELTFDIKEVDYEHISKAVLNNILSASDHEGNPLDISTITIDGLEAIKVIEVETSDATADTLDNNADETTNTTASDNTSYNEAPFTKNVSNDNITGEYSIVESSSTEDSSTEGSSTEDSSTENPFNETTSNQNQEDTTTSASTNRLLTGDYVITYTIVDNTGLSGTASITLHIVDITKKSDAEEDTTTYEYKENI